MTRVVDASVVVAALIDTGPLGQWAESQLTGEDLCAPHLMPAEVANILRRATLVGDVPTEVAALAHADLGALPVRLFPYDVVAERVWELRDGVTAYDGWYVALAEALEAALVTADVALTRASGPRCGFSTPSL